MIKQQGYGKIEMGVFEIRRENTKFENTEALQTTNIKASKYASKTQGRT